jgi:hypothetical protein
MNAISNEDFVAQVMGLARPDGEFEPSAVYDADGDCIEFLVKPDPFYAERVDDLVTVYYSQETNEVIGSLLKGVSGFCEKVLEQMPGFRIEVIDGRVKLVHIFRAKMWASPNDPGTIKTLTYRKLIKAAEESAVETELCMV